MKRKIIFLLCLALPLYCMAQDPLSRGYFYDDAGNRTLRKVIRMATPPLAPPPPAAPKSVVTNPEEAKYFVEKIAQVEMKIFPNPTTEKITLQISNMENLQTGVFKLFSLNGQLLQEQPVHSAVTTVSLVGLAKGTYILKVHINEVTEDWKIIKN